LLELRAPREFRASLDPKARMALEALKGFKASRG
jgi:hypothetical protein